MPLSTLPHARKFLLKISGPLCQNLTQNWRKFTQNCQKIPPQQANFAPILGQFSPLFQGFCQGLTRQLNCCILITL